MLKDEALTEIAAHPPENGEALERIRAVPKGFATSRLGKGLMEAIAAGRKRRRPKAPTGQPPRRRREPSPAAIDLLKTLLRLRAEAAGVAPRLIANAEDIERLAAGEDDGVAALTGWRAEVFGNDARLLRKGDWPSRWKMAKRWSWNWRVSSDRRKLANLIEWINSSYERRELGRAAGTEAKGERQ